MTIPHIRDSCSGFSPAAAFCSYSANRTSVRSSRASVNVSEAELTAAGTC